MNSLIILEQGIFPFHSCEIVVWNRLRRSHTVCWWSGNWLEFSELELPVKTGFHLVISNKAKPPNFVVLKLTYPSVLQLVYQGSLAAEPGNQKTSQEIHTGSVGAILPEELQICAWPRAATRELDEAGLQHFDYVLRKSCLVGSRKRLNDEIIKHNAVK